jgi:hypothetical protein
MTISWVVVPCCTDISVVLATFVSRAIRAFITLMTEAAGISDTSVNVYQTTQCNNQKTTIFIFATMRI